MQDNAIAGPSGEPSQRRPDRRQRKKITLNDNNSVASDDVENGFDDQNDTVPEVSDDLLDNNSVNEDYDDSDESDLDELMSHSNNPFYILQHS